MKPASTRAAMFITGAVALGVSSSAIALPVFVDQTANYRYINASGGGNCTPGAAPANWFAVGFDDSAWNTGNGPFSSGPTSGTFGADLSNVNAPFAPGPTQPIPGTFTQWNVNNCPLVRTTFTLAAPTALTIWIAVDNGIGLQGGNGIYVNGVQGTGTVNAEGQAFRWETVFDIPATYTFTGTNLIALQLEDHGGATAFDMMVTGQAPDSSNPPFTTKPPPTQPGTVPEPTSLLLLGASLAVLRMTRRRRAT
jgi:hypothetical protein